MLLFINYNLISVFLIKNKKIFIYLFQNAHEILLFNMQNFTFNHNVNEIK